MSNVLVEEFIGLEVEVVKSSHEDFEGIKGVVVDETQNTFKIEVGKDVKTVPKKENTFKFTLDNKEKIEVLGSEINIRPVERIKKLWKR
ncbi:MAG: ribonuclease P protein subunit [Candidatus Diapherotrites archaeon]|nr:ribonuclease P protein subunit [Candidatus Diapherotrites archaeon]